jgi:hypothetical protein
MASPSTVCKGHNDNVTSGLDARTISVILQLQLNEQVCSACCLLDAGFFFGLFFDLEDEGDISLSKLQSVFAGLHGDVSSTTEYLIIIFQKW